MDDRRFDNLTKQLAAGSSRRALFKVLAGGVAAGLAAVTGAGADAAARQPNGAACSRATDCTSLKCADGVCCDKACTGQCERCATGACLPVVGQPVGNRPACPGSGPCQATCDGATRTRCAAFPGGDVACGATTCAGGWLTTSACGGNGSCVPTTTNCAPYGCAASGTACASGCTSDAQCGAGSACVGGQCQAAQGLGTACTAGNQCQSGVCSQGVCCNVACNDPCFACNVAGNVGLCSPTPGVSCDDGNPCTANDVCRNNGSCKGTPVVCAPRGVCETSTCNPATGACDYRPASGAVCRPAAGPCDVPEVCDGVSFDCPPDDAQPATFVCRAASCVDGLAAPATTCNGTSNDCPPPAQGEPCAAGVCSGETEATITVCQGAGVCVPKTVDCGLYLCVDGPCPTACADHDDCVGAAFCADGVCQGDRPLGGTCATLDECVSGHCTGGICCDAPCNGPCQTCATGTCEGTTGNTCSGTGVCAGTCQAGTCVFPDAALSCADATCSTPTMVAVGVCDGAGGCTSEITDCAPYICADGACLSSCGDDDDCADDGACDDGVCQALEPNGAACDDPAQCASGICAGGVCCAGDCDDNDPCTTDTCDPAGSCVNTPVADDLRGGCQTGEVCCSGTCTAGSCGAVCSPTLTCPPGQTCCGDGQCYDPASGLQCASSCTVGGVLVPFPGPCQPGLTTTPLGLCQIGTCQDSQVVCPYRERLIDGVCRTPCGTLTTFCPDDKVCCRSALCCDAVTQVCITTSPAAQCVDVCHDGRALCGGVCCPTGRSCSNGVCRNCGSANCDPVSQICCAGDICCNTSTQTCGSAHGTCAQIPTCPATQVYIPALGICCAQANACGDPPTECCNAAGQTCTTAGCLHL